MLMDELKKVYENSSLDMPKRHFWHRFIRDFRQFHLKSIDYVHHTVPLCTEYADGFVFPGEYVGQYGAYDAI